VPALPVEAGPGPVEGIFPPAGGYRFAVAVFAPERSDAPAIEAGAEGGADDLRAIMAEDGMHATDTVDFGYVASGEIWMRLDSGEEVALRSGDCFVQNGTRHAWHNRSGAPCTVVMVLVGAERTAR
jgi:mannose-6-phosphate isomerase-like protein (cupin superfamily)